MKSNWRSNWIKKHDPLHPLNLRPPLLPSHCRYRQPTCKNRQFRRRFVPNAKRALNSQGSFFIIIIFFFNSPRSLCLLCVKVKTNFPLRRTINSKYESDSHDDQIQTSKLNKQVLQFRKDKHLFFLLCWTFLCLCITNTILWSALWALFRRQVLKLFLIIVSWSKLSRRGWNVSTEAMSLFPTPLNHECILCTLKDLRRPDFDS